VERLSPKLYGSTSSLSPGGSVGGHFRHCLDFYGCLLDGLPSGRIDYTARARDRAVESQPQRCIEGFRSVIARLEALRNDDAQRPLSVRGDGGPDEGTGWSRSTLGRELQFLLSHTIHHFALIGFMLRASGMELEPSFGVAPTTLRHWKATAAGE
jgi:uncharacterized damage-inducible protein DinB